MSEEPSPQELHKDILDFVLAGTKSRQWVQTEQGNQQVDIPDPEIAYWMTRSVNAQTFARFVYQLKLLESMAEQCKYNTSYTRAQVLANEILALVAVYKRSIDAKSSESVLDKNNRQANFLDKFVSAKSERILTVKGNTRTGIGAALLGKESDNEQR